MPKRLRFFYSWLTLGYALVALVIYLSLAQQLPQAPLVSSDKAQHFMAYTTLSLWFCWLYEAKKLRLVHAIGLVLLGVALEYLQGFTDYRHFDVADMAANTAGVLMGILITLPPFPNPLAWFERRLGKPDRI